MARGSMTKGGRTVTATKQKLITLPHEKTSKGTGSITKGTKTVTARSAANQGRKKGQGTAKGKKKARTSKPIAFVNSLIKKYSK